MKKKVQFLRSKLHQREQLQRELSKQFPPFFTANRSLEHHTTLRTGGMALYYFEISGNVEQLAAVVETAKKKGVRYATLGRGSNVLIQDEPVEMFVLHMGETSTDPLRRRADWKVGTIQKVRFSAGMSLQKAIRVSHTAGLVGMEFASGVPGTVGGAVKMNAGTRMGSLADSCVEVEVFRNGKQRILEASQLSFGYRSSLITAEDVVISASFGLKVVDKIEMQRIQAACKSYMDYRLRTQPNQSPNAGSAFKNPSSDKAAAFWIEQAGLMGKTIGGIQVSTKHANFLVNTGTGTATDATNLIATIQKVVAQKFQVDLVPEVYAFPSV